jgi:4-diphosphocytidyl-2-C-methyl-D-erythritol kinase
LITFPNCKINLGLNIIRKRADGFHDLETVFFPLPLYDALEIIRKSDNQNAFEFSGSGLIIDTAPQDNICTKAYQLLKNDFPNLPALSLHLHKNIPFGAGLGGGSADGAFTLLLINEQCNLGLDTSTLLKYALHLGSDCPFFIINRPALAKGRGEKLTEISLDLSSCQTVLVNPGIPINTGWAFSKVSINPNQESLKEIIQSPMELWKEKLVNAFEKPVFAAFPEIEKIKKDLYEAGAVYASMSGSGSSVFALFSSGTPPDLRFPPHYFVKTFR